MLTKPPWLLVTTGAVLSALTGPFIWTGRLRGIARRWRNPYVPALFRGSAVTAPLLGLLLLPELALFGPSQLGIQTVALSHRLTGVLVLGGAGYGFLVIGASVILSSRTPRWIIPPWLREEDASLGYVPPPLDYFDRILVVGGAAFVVGGLLFFGWSLLTLFGPGA
jgi:hypothetical protein